jgi:ankyrin repeat protein
MKRFVGHAEELFYRLKRAAVDSKNGEIPSLDLSDTLSDFGTGVTEERSDKHTIQKPPAFSPQAIKAHQTMLDEEEALLALEENRFEEAESALHRCIEASTKWPQGRPPYEFKKSAEKWRLLLGWRLYNRQQCDQAIETTEPIILSPNGVDDDQFQARYLLALSFKYKGIDAKVEEHCVETVKLKERLSVNVKHYFDESVELLWDLYKKGGFQVKAAYLENFVFQGQQAEFRNLVRTAKDMSYSKAQDFLFPWLERNLDLDKLEKKLIQVDGNQYGVWGPGEISWHMAFKQTLEKSVEEGIFGASTGCCLLHILAACNKWALIRVLLNEGTKVDSRLEFSEFTPLALAIYYQAFQTVRMLLEKKPFMGVKCFGKTNFDLVELASKTSNAQMRGLISNLAYWKGDSLHTAILTGRLTEAKELIKKGVNVNFAYNELTPLLQVCQRYPGQTDLITLLLQAGANPNVSVSGKLQTSTKTRIRMTPLVYAIQADNLEVVKHLVERKADLPNYVLQKPHKMNCNRSMKFVQNHCGTRQQQ